MEHITEITLKSVKIKRITEDCYETKFVTSVGANKALLHHREGNRAGTVLVGGTGGGVDGPAAIYPDLGHRLLEHGISSLRLDYTKPAYLEECILDVQVGIEYLKSLDIVCVGLVGWSFGGAVVIDAGAHSDTVRAVATVASQTYGAGKVSRLSPRPLLLIHGTSDRTLPPSCSEDLYKRAREPKELVLFEHANHGVDQKRDEMLATIEEFLVSNLGDQCGPQPDEE